MQLAVHSERGRSREHARQQVKAVERITATMGLVDVAKYPDKTIAM